MIIVSVLGRIYNEKLMTITNPPTAGTLILITMSFNVSADMALWAQTLLEAIIQFKVGNI